MQVTWCILIDVVHWKPIGVTAGTEARLLGMKGFELAMLTFWHIPLRRGNEMRVFLPEPPHVIDPILVLNGWLGGWLGLLGGTRCVLGEGIFPWSDT
jgi:hypothetical protein